MALTSIEATTEAYIGYKAVLEYHPLAGVALGTQPDSDGVYDGRLAQVQSFSGVAGEADEFEVTNFDSPGSTKEFIAGLIDNGEATITLVYKSDEAKKIVGSDVEPPDTDATALTRLDRWWRITLPDGSNPGMTSSVDTEPGSTIGSTLEFKGFVKSFGWTVETQGVILNPATLRVAGNIRYTKAGEISNT